MSLLQNLFVFIVPFLFVLTLVVTVHELGHFWAARYFKVAVDRFSIGFGRAIASWTDKSGVEWRIGWMPFGGYVRFAHDENAASVPDKEDLDSMRAQILAEEGSEGLQHAYHFKPVWQRAIISAAGPIANFLLAIIIFSLLFMSFGRMQLDPRIGEVEPGSAAAAAGFKAGDLVVRADDQKIGDFTDLQRYVVLRAGLPIRFEVDRGGAAVTLTATPRPVEQNDAINGRHQVGLLGVKPDVSESSFRRVRYSPLQAVPAGFGQTWTVLSTTVFYLGRVVTGQVPPDQIGGFIRIAKASGEVAKMGAEGAPDVSHMLLGATVNLIQLAGLLSVSLGFMNLLPIPVLDGGHLLFYAYEAVARRPLAARIQAVGYRLGLALLVGFMLFAGWNDLHRYDVFKKLGDLLF
jgi:regulator of sigma E protease